MTRRARAEVEVRRVALNMDQIQQYRPPPNPSKETDPRYRQYTRQYGEHCWELDALPPNVLDQLARDAITEVIDPELWNEAQDQEQSNRELISAVSENWTAVTQLIREEQT